MKIAPEELKTLLSYDPESGDLTWLPRPESMHPRVHSWNARYANKPAFTHVNRNGYRMGNILGRSYDAHLVIWALSKGSWPTIKVDHRNGVKTDNRLDNLRLATNSENGMNRPSHKRYKGVSFRKDKGKWRTRCAVAGKTYEISGFATEERAALAYNELAKKHHGEFARLNQIGGHNA